METLEKKTKKRNKLSSVVKIPVPNGRWSNTSYSLPVLNRFYGSYLLSSRQSTGKGFAGSKIADHCFTEEDVFNSLNGALRLDYLSDDSQNLLPKGEWYKDAFNTLWTRSEDLIHTENSLMNIPCIPDINGALRQINDEQLIYINTFLGSNAQYPSSCFALSSEIISNVNDRFSGVANENDNTLKIAKRNNFDIDPPEGDWFKYSKETFYTFRFFDVNLLVAELETGEDTYKTAITCYNEGDELTNDHGYFRFSQIGDKTDTVLPEGNWRDTAFNIVWASANQLCNLGKIRSVSGNWVNTESENLIFLSCFLDHGSINSRTIFTFSNDELTNNQSRFERKE